MGMTGHWINVKKKMVEKKEVEAWKLWWGVVGFKAVSGEHSGKNLGQYFVQICKHAGIVTEDQSKVCYPTTCHPIPIDYQPAWPCDP